MKSVIIAAIFAVSFIGVSAASADVIDDNVVKAEKSLANAQKRLEKALACQTDRETCLAEMTAKAQKAADRAAKKLADLKADTTASVAE